VKEGAAIRAVRNPGIETDLLLPGQVPVDMGGLGLEVPGVDADQDLVLLLQPKIVQDSHGWDDNDKK